MTTQDLIKQAFRASCYELLTKPHPLSPDAIDEATALRLMRAAVEKQGGTWRLLWIGYFILATEIDAETFWPDAAIVARSHCSGCGDVLCELHQAECAACSEWVFA